VVQFNPIPDTITGIEYLDKIHETRYNRSYVRQKRYAKEPDGESNIFERIKIINPI